MSRDWTHYDARCTSCGATGEVGHWMDDWNRTGSSKRGVTGVVRPTGPRPEDMKCEACGGGPVEFTQRP